MPITDSSEEKAMKKDLTQEKIPVWVVDDEVRYSIRFALATHGIDARTYASGEDFFNLVETDQPGCLVVDLTMPGMSAFAISTAPSRSSCFPATALSARPSKPWRTARSPSWRSPSIPTTFS